MTRRALTLHLLREAGSRGITTAELLQAGVGSRYSARIMELREQGHVIESERVREGSWRYVLSHDIERDGGTRPPTAPPAAVAPGAVGDTLFELPPGRSAALHDWEDAAA